MGSPSYVCSGTFRQARRADAVHFSQAQFTVSDKLVGMSPLHVSKFCANPQRATPQKACL